MAFGYSGLKSIVIPDRVTWIGAAAFFGCSELTSVVIPDSVREIGFRAFDECSALTSILVHVRMTEYYKELLPVYLHDKIKEL